MVCIICEPNYVDDVWGKQKYDGLISVMKKRRIKYAVIEQLTGLKNVVSSEPIIIIAIGTHKSWYSHIISRCNLINVRVITFGDILFHSVEGNYSCITSDLKTSAMDIGRYFSAHAKKSAVLFGVNDESEFDLQLEKDIADFLPNHGISVKSIRAKKAFSESIEKFVSDMERYDSIICTNDYAAILLIAKIKEICPEYLEKVFLVSFSNTLLSLIYSPSITTFYETNIGVEYVLKIYYLLMQNPEISSIHFSIKEHVKIRETTHYCPYSLLEFDHLIDSSEITDSKETAEDQYARQSSFYELEKIEKMFQTFDKMDFNILILLLGRKTTLDIANMLYTSRGSVRYRISHMAEQLEVKNKEEIVELLKKFVSVEALCKYADDFIE